jgi:3-deoxy-7-phosphoheptulonate synthase
MNDWHPASWKSRTATQQPEYDDPEEVERVVADMARLPPLVTSWEIETLKGHVADAAEGRTFLLQAGDCAESFERCDSRSIADKLKILLQMSVVLVHGTGRPVVRIGRIAGQYAKPRSSPHETRGELTLPSYRGDLVNRSSFSAGDRRNDPQLLVRGYERAALTLNFIRALADGGFADLHHPEYWDLEFVRHASASAEYLRIIDSIRDGMRFMESVSQGRLADTRRVQFFTCHEGLSLLYEQAQTRQVPRRPGWYNLSTHLPWIGMRTADIDGAHVEYFRGIRNPIAVKVGPGMTRDRLLRLLDVLHPQDEPGRLTLIHRMGADAINEKLPPLLEAVQSSGKTVAWCADPMHGNTETTAEGIKTRRLERILAEIREAIRIHGEVGAILAGVHLEVTGEDVTECIGGARGLDETGLKRAYHSQVDPRLNYEQAMEMALLVSHGLRSTS